jgi:hypothetical protein
MGEGEDREKVGSEKKAAQGSPGTRSLIAMTFRFIDSTLATILPPEELIRLVQQRVKGSLKGIAIFSGTPPLATGEMVFTDRFECEVLDPILKRKITIGYSIHTLDWFRA